MPDLEFPSKPADSKQRPNAARLLRWSVALVWLATGLAVVHPYYREVGSAYLARLSLPSWIMVATCGGEVLLGLWVAVGWAAGAASLVQIMLIVGFTAILAWLEPMLLVHPLGVLTKNLCLLAVIGTAWLLEREGWSRRALWLLRAGVAVVWITEGLGPKVFFQQSMEVAIVAQSGLVPIDPGLFLRLLGIAEAGAGLGVLLLRGWPLRWLLALQLAALFLLPLLITVREPWWWVHPFGPFTKNVPLIAATWVLWRRPRSPEA